MELEEALAQADVYSTGETGEYCMLESDTSRVVVIPDRYKTFGVEGDNRAERIKFKFPKVVGDNIDLSSLNLRINYQNAQGGLDKYIVETVLETEDDHVFFTWLIQDGVTPKSGPIYFVVQAVKVTSNGNIEKKWSTTLNKIGQVLEGLEVDETIAQQNPDIIEALLQRMDDVEDISTPEAMQEYVNQYLAENPPSGMTAEQEQQLNQNTTDVSDLKSAIEKNTNDITDLSRVVTHKVNDSGWKAGKYLGTDDVGNVVAKDATGNINENGISSKIMAGIINLNMADTQNKYKAKGALGFSVLDDQLEKNVSKYILENGEKINGAPATREEIKDYLLNRDNCLKRGALHKNGIYLVDSDEVPVEIRGIGTHLLTAYTNMHTAEAIKTLKYYGINCIRISVYIEDRYDTAPASGSSGTLWKGYLNDASNIKTEIEKIVDICIEQGLYCILDWHVMSGGGGGGASDLHQTEATEFFTYYAQLYADTPNVWYEFANEPFQTTYTDLANFVSSMRSIVKTYVDNPVMFTGVGRGGGVKETYSALSSLGIDDVFVSLHSYGTSYQANFTSLRNEGIPVCTTEWGIGAESGELTEGMIELAKGNLEYLHTEGILQCIWKFTDQEKASNWGILKLRDNTPNSEYYSHGGYIDELDLSEKGEILLGAFCDYAFSDWIERLTVAADRCIITYNLIGVSSSNNAKVVKEGESYSTTLSFLEGYNDIQTISITMGESDITSTAYNNDTHAINITHVSDDIVITVTAISNPDIGRYPLKNGISNFTDGTKLTVSGGNHVKLERGTAFNGFANISDYERNSNNPTSNASAINNLPAFANVQSGDNVKIMLKNISISTTSVSGYNYFSFGVRTANASVSIPNFSIGNQMTYSNYDEGINVDATIDDTVGCGCVFIYLADIGLKTIEFDVEITVNGIRWV